MLCVENVDNYVNNFLQGKLFKKNLKFLLTKYKNYGIILNVGGNTTNIKRKGGMEYETSYIFKIKGRILR